MARRYNPPPNWPPAPLGWSPPEGWEPDPSWGPAPEGWETWIEDDRSAKKSKPWLWIAAVALAFFIGLGIAAAGGGEEPDTTTAAKEDPAPGATVTATTTEEVSGPATTETVTAKPPPPVHTIDEGVWEVGSDIKTGTYKIIEPISGDCYWQISPIGKDDIIDNGLPTGGRPTVVLRKGQEFTNQGCGTWGRQ